MQIPNRNKVILPISFFFLALIGGFNFSAQAGWYIVQKNSFGDGSTAFTKISVQQNRYMVEEGTIAIVFNLNTEEFAFMDKNSKQYWSGSINAIQKEFEVGIDQIVEEQFGQLTAVQRDRMSPIIELLKKQVGCFEQDSINHQVQIISNEINNAEIKAEMCEAYQISVDGKVAENIWISRRNKLSNELDWSKLGTMLDRFYAIGKQPAYRSNKAYILLMEQGIVVRSINAIGTISELISIQEKESQGIDFSVPGNFKQASLIRLMNKQINEDVKF